MSLTNPKRYGDGLMMWVSGLARRVWCGESLLAERLYTDVYNFYKGAESGSVYKWHDNRNRVRVSGTVIQQHVLIERGIFEGIPHILHLYQMCALKSMNEAVVEGMCKTFDRHAVGERGLQLKRYAYESIMHYNMPAQNQLNDFIHASIKICSSRFSNCASMLRFHSTDKRQGALKYFVSKTVDRHMAAQSKLAFM